MLQQALDWQRHGYPVALLKPGAKGYLFKDPKAMTPTELKVTLSRRRANLGLYLKDSGLMVADGDTPWAVGFMEANGLMEGLLIGTRRGVHSVMRHDIENPTNVLNYKGLGLDLLFNVSTPLPPSKVVYPDGSAHTYSLISPHLVPADKLPFFPKHLIEKKRPQPIASLVGRSRESLVRYISRIEAHSGSNGHNSAFRCACRIANEVDDVREALAIFLNWNETNAFPPFSEGEAIHKIKDAFKKKVRT